MSRVSAARAPTGRQLPTLDMCARQCGAKCCRAPLVLEVTGEELAAMLAVRPDVEHNGQSNAYVNMATGETIDRTIFTFADEVGQRCPFLDPTTNRCTVYEARPASCRGFPDRPESWCLAWPEA